MSIRLSYAHGASDVELLSETIGANLERMVERQPDAIALVSRHQGLRYTYAELDAAVDRVARGLISARVERGDRVGIWSPNCAEWVLVQYAAAKLGAVLVNLNPAYRTTELEYALNLSGTSVLLATTTFKTSDYVAMVEEVRGAVPTLEAVVHLGTEGWDALLAAGERVPIDSFRRRCAWVQFDDPVSIQYTSGTTGAPKGVTLSHHNILNNGFFVGEGLGYTQADNICVPVPFFHNFGMVLGNLASISHGATIVLPSAGFDPAAVLTAIHDERCTSLYGVPTMYIAELEHPEFDRFDLRSLRTGIMAGSPCPIDLVKRVIERMHMRQIAICYGMTETSSVTTQTALDETLERRVSTVGRVHPHFEIKIVDPHNGRVLPRGQVGELLSRGYSVMRGYWNDPERTAEFIDGARWAHTGDLAAMDDDGYVNIVGRIKDMIIRGGENLFPREIEAFLLTHPDVLDVAVVGVPDERYGEEIMAWIKLREGSRHTEEDIRAFCRGRISHQKVPRYVRFTDAFPHTVTGKIRKAELRRLAIEALELQAPAAMQTA